MNQDVKKQFLDEALRIGEGLLEKAIEDEHGIHWKTMSMDKERNVNWVEIAGVYAGNSGIALFFMELFRVTGTERYLDTAKRCLQWVVHFCQTEESDYYSFFTGRMGVAYTLLRMGQFLNDDSYVRQALEIARESGGFLEAQYNVDDLIGGTVGTALGLAHLHAATGEPWLLELLEKYALHLIQSANPGPSGYYWDRTHVHINGLCGFSHGAAGVGFVFMELGRYLQNETFDWMARQAFLYESNHFDPEKKNWLDLRKGVYSDEDFERFSKAYGEGNLDFFKEGGNMNAWCHGAAGVGLSRIRAWENWQDKTYEKDALLAIERTIMSDVDAKDSQDFAAFILCHGGGGNADLFIEAYRVFGDQKYLDLAVQVGERALKSLKSKGKYVSGFRDAGNNEDNSLFMGNAGIGHFYLRLVDPLNVQSILIPRLDADPVSPDTLTPYPGLRLTFKEIKKLLLQRYFRRSIKAAEELIPEMTQSFFNNGKELLECRVEETFIRFAQTGLARLKGKRRQVFEDILGLEKKKWQLDMQQESHALLHFQDEMRVKDAEDLVELDFDQLKDKKLVMACDVSIESTRWNWDKEKEDYFPDNLEAEADDFPVLIKPVPLEVAEENLSPFSEAVLMEFQEPATVGEVYEEVLAAFEELTENEQELLRAKIVEQVRAALNSGILIKATCVC